MMCEFHVVETYHGWDNKHLLKHIHIEILKWKAQNVNSATLASTWCQISTNKLWKKTNNFIREFTYNFHFYIQFYIISTFYIHHNRHEAWSQSQRKTWSTQHHRTCSRWPPFLSMHFLARETKLSMTRSHCAGVILRIATFMASFISSVVSNSPPNSPSFR